MRAHCPLPPNDSCPTMSACAVTEVGGCRLGSPQLTVQDFGSTARARGEVLDRQDDFGQLVQAAVDTGWQSVLPRVPPLGVRRCTRGSCSGDPFMATHRLQGPRPGGYRATRSSSQTPGHQIVYAGSPPGAAPAAHTFAQDRDRSPDAPC